MSHAVTKVLLVDDDVAMLRLLSKWLEGAGYELLRATNGQQAAAIIEAEAPQILLTDWEMPGMDGLELVRWVRQQSLPHYLYTIFLTIRGSSADMLLALEAGADDFLKKPVDREELLARLKTAQRVLAMEQRLNQLAKSDPMTGLATQRTFYECLGREWARSTQHKFAVSCVMLDIDFFKRINDTHGHSIGDEVIRRVAALLADNCLDNDVVSRYGGEEFGILLPERDEVAATLWAERICKQIGELQIPLGGKFLTLSASLGVAERMPDTASPQQLVDMADQALLVAKRSGRDRVVRFKSLNETAGSQVGLSPENDPASLLRSVPARSVMTTIVASLQAGDTVGAASEYFLRFRISSAPVVDDEGKLVGLLSEKDMMGIMLCPNWWEMRIRDVMKTNVVCYEEETPALAIYEFLCRVTLRGAVIVSDGRPTGLISRSSLLRYFTNALAMNKSHQHDERSRVEEQVLSAVAAAKKPRQRISQTVQALVDETLDLQCRLQDGGSDLVPCVVGGVSRIQELVNDLLAYSGYANSPAEYEPLDSSSTLTETTNLPETGSFLAACLVADQTEAGARL